MSVWSTFPGVANSNLAFSYNWINQPKIIIQTRSNNFFCNLICQFCIIAWLMRFDRMVGVPTCAAHKAPVGAACQHHWLTFESWVRQLWVHCSFSCHALLDVHASIGWWQSATFSSQSIKVMANSVKVSNIPQQTSDIVIFKIRRIDIHWLFIQKVAFICLSHRLLLSLLDASD